MSSHSSDGVTLKKSSPQQSPHLFTSYWASLRSHYPQRIRRLAIVRQVQQWQSAPNESSQRWRSRRRRERRATTALHTTQQESVFDEWTRGWSRGRWRQELGDIGPTHDSARVGVWWMSLVGHVVDDVRNWATSALHTTQQSRCLMTEPPTTRTAHAHSLHTLSSTDHQLFNRIGLVWFNLFTHKFRTGKTVGKKRCVGRTIHEFWFYQNKLLTWRSATTNDIDLWNVKFASWVVLTTCECKTMLN